MNTCDIIQLLNKQYEEPSFVVNSLNIDSTNVGRGFTKDPKDKKILNYIVQTHSLSVSQIVDDKLVPVESIGAFVNTNTYLVHWTFTMVYEQMELILENVFFYWKGSKAPKGLSPLPPDVDNETAIVNRIVQWSEPPVFFHLLEEKRMVVFEDNFDPSSPHLFIVLGELSKELHLYEVSFMKKNLRSRGVFVIAVPQKKIIYIWKGSQITNELDAVVKGACLGNTVRNYVDSWKNFEILEMKETEEDILFEGDTSEYWHVKEVCNYS
uniref:Supervillin-like n=1 Tax=Diabrotica virgifera virgifera TaxID=50390 RepID=A0A6P7FLF0_DIAVI